MRWILPLLSLSVVSSALAERAVYTGSLKVQNLANPSASSVVKVAELIDLETGKIITVALSGTKLNFVFSVGSEVECVIAKATDAKQRSTTAFAQAAAALDASGSKFALSTVLKGTDATVKLGDTGTSRWPRSLSGSGSLVAAAGVDATATPGGISLSTIALTLSEPYSKLANNSGGTLDQCAEVIGQAYRDAVAKSLHYPLTNGTASTGTNAAAPSGDVYGNGSPAGPGSSGVALQGVGAITLMNMAPAGFGFLKTGTGTGGVNNVTNFQGGTLELYPTYAGSISSAAAVRVSIGGSLSIANPFLGSVSSSTLTIAPPAYSTAAGSLEIRTGSSTGFSGSVNSTVGTIGAGGITKVGTGTLTLGSANTLTLNSTSTYTGGIVVNSGTLTLAPGSTLTGSGSLANLTGTGNLTLAGTVSPIIASQLSAWTAVDASGATLTIGSPEFNALFSTGRFTGSITSHTLTFVPNVTIVPPTSTETTAPTE